MANKAAQQLGRRGGRVKSKAKTAAARANGRRRYQTTINYQLYDLNNAPFKEGHIVVKKKLDCSLDGDAVTSLILNELTYAEIHAHYRIDTTVDVIETTKPRSGIV